MDDDARSNSHNHLQTPTIATCLHAAANNNARSGRCGELEEEDNFAEERGGGAVVLGSVPYVFWFLCFAFHRHGTGSDREATTGTEVAANGFGSGSAPMYSTASVINGWRGCSAVGSLVEFWKICVVELGS